ncbi:MAG: 16S rRNA (guanine(527)-N(7))-methyltransferase RsmG [Lachnospiraceae bacterium]|nr:16S rRNA (guanine(527)-N(7))-methyltransferase RsmG [Lachnospiraceae bacterium]
MEFRDEMKKAASDFGTPLEDVQLDQLVLYNSLLLEWNQKMNLTAITDPKEVAVKHMVDSLSAFDASLFRDGMRVIDVGSGAGFPGLALKIYFPSMKMVLLDSLQKRVKFLETVVSVLGLSGVVCVHGRAEETARQKEYRERFDLALSRAVARLSVLSEYTLPFVRVGGSLLALKGAKYAEEMAEAETAAKILGGGAPTAKPVKLPGLDDGRAIVRVDKIKPTPENYPRKSGTPEKKPLGQ